MTTTSAIDPQIKAAVMKAIHEEGVSAYKASKVYGVNYSTIKSWLAKETRGSEKNYISQINQLKKRLDNAYRVIGKLTAEVQHPKD